jgi:chromosome segregation protein
MARFLKLERMEIHGFKSFYGRTRFEFPEGITAVVGPNGCGKSNIGDAISWVLGEQKASSLRSDRMEDVIFNGSQGRKPLGMAEVSLIFRNIAARSDTACGTVDGDGLAEASAILAAGNGHGNGNGNGNGHGNGHGTIETDGLAPEPAADAGEVPPDATGAVTAGAAAADATAIDGAATGAAATDGASSQGSRFYLEDLPGEVVVTRRLFRSGESEYAVNGERCRLRDIQDLLARTEIGTRLYTTIEQGKIDQILLAKPKERRAIIEEAAGILGYKIKRRQTEQKLEATQANLMRIADIAGEVDKQIQSLRRQAAKARRYRRLMDTLREKRGVVAWRRLQHCDTGLAEAGMVIDDLRARDAGTAAELARAEADLESLRQKLDAAEGEARQRRDTIHALDIEIDRLQARLAAGEQQGADLAARAAAAEGEITALAARSAEHEARRDVLSADLAAEAECVREAEAALAAIEDERAARAATILAEETAIEGMRAALLALLDRVAEIGRRRAALEEQGRAAEIALRRLEREASEASESRHTLEAEVGALRSRADMTRAALEARRVDADGRAEQARAAEDRRAAAEKRREELRGRSAGLAERLTALEALEKRHAGFDKGVAAILSGGGGFAPRGIVGERMQVPAGLERAVAAALGPLQEAVLVGAREDAVTGVGFLRREAGGRAAFVVEGEPAGASAPGASPAGEPGVAGILGTLVGGVDPRGAVGTRLARVALVADLGTALRLRSAWPGWSFATREGDIVDADGAITGGDGPALQHGVLARRAERSDLTRQHESVEAERRACEGGLEEFGAAVSIARHEETVAAATLQAAQRDLFQADLELQSKEAERARIEATLPVLAGEAARLERERAGRAGEDRALAEGWGAHEEERRRGEEGIRAAAEALAARRREHEEVQRRAGDARARVAAGHQRLAALARERDGVELALREVRLRAAQLASEQADWRARVAALTEQAESLRSQAKQAGVTRAGAAAEEEAGLAGLAYDRSLLQAREQAAREGRAALQETRQALQEQEIRRARLSSDLGHLESECREDLGMDLAALRAAPPPAFDAGRPLEEDEAEVAQARESIEAVGPVNLMAIEQCAELEERFGFLDAQRRDLEAAVESLRDTIRRINRESRQRFMAAFEAIHLGFRESFTTLFGGGRAELRLQEGEDDVLEAGIEIAAQPPGKRLQSLALLSGGEKALTAVALLFALFRYRPSPFCVLDEVDAPLDEANVVRFTDLLRTLTTETQFILITHNRRSMEAANLLYGVTMEEPGVSKVLPLRFE